jgi:anti-sigma factor (TIGR02949 family)
MDCKEVSRALFLFFDNEMEEGLKTPFCDHVNRCPQCAKEVAYTERFLLIVRLRCVRCPASDDLRHRVLTSFPHRQERGLEQL